MDATGYGLIDVKNGNGSAVLLEAGLIRTKISDSLPLRLAAVARQLETLLSECHPDLMVVEDIYSHYKTPQPAILMGHVRGVVLKTAAEAEIPVVSYMPTRVKKAVVGKGHASKVQIARMVQMRLGLEDKPIPADVSDAIAVALCHANHLKNP